MWTLQRIRLNSQGYTSQGHYYGLDAPLFWACSPDGRADHYFRARNRAAAKEHVRKHFDAAARFYN